VLALARRWESCPEQGGGAEMFLGLARGGAGMMQCIEEQSAVAAKLAPALPSTLNLPSPPLPKPLPALVIVVAVVAVAVAVAVVGVHPPTPAVPAVWLASWIALGREFI